MLRVTLRPASCLTDRGGRDLRAVVGEESGAESRRRICSGSSSTRSVRLVNTPRLCLQALEDSGPKPPALQADKRHPCSSWRISPITLGSLVVTLEMGAVFLLILTGVKTGKLKQGGTLLRDSSVLSVCSILLPEIYLKRPYKHRESHRL